MVQKVAIVRIPPPRMPRRLAAYPVGGTGIGKTAPAWNTGGGGGGDGVGIATGNASCLDGADHFHFTRKFMLNYGWNADLSVYYVQWVGAALSTDIFWITFFSFFFIL